MGKDAREGENKAIELCHILFASYGGELCARSPLHFVRIRTRAHVLPLQKFIAVLTIKKRRVFRTFKYVH